MKFEYDGARSDWSGCVEVLQVGTVMVRWVTKYCDPVMATGWHMVLGSLPLIALSAAQEGPELTARLSGLTGDPSQGHTSSFSAHVLLPSLNNP